MPCSRIEIARTQRDVPGHRGTEVALGALCRCAGTPVRLSACAPVPLGHWATERVMRRFFEFFVESLPGLHARRSALTALLLCACCVCASVRPVAAQQCPDGTPPPCARRPARPATAAPIVPPTYRQLTSSGNVNLATLSPDGRFLAYAENRALWVRNLVDGGRPVEVSREGYRWFRGVQWFPDATMLLASGMEYRRSDIYSMYLIPSLGGTTRSLPLFPGAQFSRLSPDGRRTVQWAHPRKWLHISDVETGARRDSLPVPGTYAFLLDVDWSPDGRFLAAITYDGARRYTIRTVSTTNRSARVVLDDSVPLDNPRWDARSSAIYYLRVVGDASQLWKVPVASSSGARIGPPTMVMPLLEASAFDLVENGQHLAFLRVRSTSNIWIARSGPDSTRRWLTTGSAISSSPRLSPDGRMVAFIQGDLTSTNAFVVGSDSGPATQLTFLRDRQVRGLAWSPSGRQVAYCTTGEASPEMAIVTLTGTRVAVPATSGLSDGCDIAWGTDDEILYNRVGNRNFAILSLSGRPERLLVSNDSVGFMFSPLVDASGDRVAVEWNRPRDGGQRIWVISRRDSSQRRLTGGSGRALRWASDGQMLYALLQDRVCRLDVSRPDSVEATAFPACPGSTADVSADGSRMVCTDGQTTSDAWLIRNFDPTARPAPPPRRP